MNIAPKFLDIKTSPPAERSEERPEADEDSVKDFLLGLDEPIKPEPYVPLGSKGESADQDFLHALSITSPETPLPPQENIASTDIFTASISEHLMAEAKSLQTSPLTVAINVDETILPAPGMRTDSLVPSAEVLPAPSPMVSTDIRINLRPPATHIEPAETHIEHVEGKAPVHPHIAIDGLTPAPVKNAPINAPLLETPSLGSGSTDLVADDAKDQTRLAANPTVKDAAAKLGSPQHKVMIETATPKEARPASPESVDTREEMRTVKAERIAAPVGKVAPAVYASSDTVAKAIPPEISKTFRSSPAFSAEETVKPESAVLKETPLSLPLSKKVEIAHNLVADAPKLTGDITLPLTPLGNPISDSAVKAPQAVTIITAPTSTSHPALQTVAQTLVKAQETQSGISVRLDPPEMGRVFIDFKFDADRNVTAIIRSEISETAILLKDKAEFFQQTLKDSGFNSINLSFEQNDQSKQKAFDPENAGKAPALFQAEQSDDDTFQTAPPPSHRYKLSADTAIDIKL